MTTLVLSLFSQTTNELQWNVKKYKDFHFPAFEPSEKKLFAKPITSRKWPFFFGAALGFYSNFELSRLDENSTGGNLTEKQACSAHFYFIDCAKEKLSANFMNNKIHLCFAIFFMVGESPWTSLSNQIQLVPYLTHHQWVCNYASKMRS